MKNRSKSDERAMESEPGLFKLAPETLDNVLAYVVIDDLELPTRNVAQTLGKVGLINRDIYRLVNQSASPIAKLNTAISIERSLAIEKFDTFAQTDRNDPAFESHFKELIPYAGILTKKEREPIEAIVSERHTEMIEHGLGAGFGTRFRELVPYTSFMTNEQKRIMIGTILMRTGHDRLDRLNDLADHMALLDDNTRDSAAFGAIEMLWNRDTSVQEKACDSIAKMRRGAHLSPEKNSMVDELEAIIPGLAERLHNAERRLKAHTYASRGNESSLTKDARRALLSTLRDHDERSR
jgi:hypothetical protein